MAQPVLYLSTLGTDCKFEVTSLRKGNEYRRPKSLSIQNYQFAVGGHSNEVDGGYSNRAYVMRCDVASLAGGECGKLVWIRLADMNVAREGKITQIHWVPDMWSSDIRSFRPCGQF